MFRLKSILTLSLIALSSGCIQSQDETFDLGFQPDTRKYTLPRWRAINLIEDAYKKRIQDTLIDSLQSRIVVLETEKVSTNKSFSEELLAERELGRKQTELTMLETSLKDYYQTQSKRYKRQRNWLVGIGVSVFTYSVVRTFKPP